MKKTVLTLLLVVGAGSLLIADDAGRLRRNEKPVEECTVDHNEDGFEVGTGYLNKDDRNYENRTNSSSDRGRRNSVSAEGCTLEESSGKSNRNNRFSQNKSNRGQGQNRRNNS